MYFLIIKIQLLSLVEISCLLLLLLSLFFLSINVYISKNVKRTDELESRDSPLVCYANSIAWRAKIRRFLWVLLRWTQPCQWLRCDTDILKICYSAHGLCSESFGRYWRHRWLYFSRLVDSITTSSVLILFVSEWTAYGKWQKRKGPRAFTKVYGISFKSGCLFLSSRFLLIYFLTTLDRNFEHLVAILKARQGRKSRPLRDFGPSSYEGNRQFKQGRRQR